MCLECHWAKYWDYFANASTSNASGPTRYQAFRSGAAFAATAAALATGPSFIAETVAVRSTLGQLAAHFKIALTATASALLLFVVQAAAQQQPQLSAHDLAKLAQNPLADTISIPFANETNFPLGPYGQTGNILNIQPVIPFRLNDDWNIVTRTTVPVISPVQHSPSDPADFGIGDIVPLIALSPSHPGDLIWGIGPTFSLPTATSRHLGSEQWTAGPTAIFST